jgi:hypothetical protein
MCGWCKSKAGRSLLILGIDVKLCRGGGHEVAHSSDPPKPQGSSTLTLGEFLLCHILIKNGIIERASSPEPTVEIIFMPVNPSEAK